VTGDLTTTLPIGFFSSSKVTIGAVCDHGDGDR
jgi:hypothetical protein